MSKSLTGSDVKISLSIGSYNKMVNKPMHTDDGLTYKLNDEVKGIIGKEDNVELKTGLIEPENKVKGGYKVNKENLSITIDEDLSDNVDRLFISGNYIELDNPFALVTSFSLSKERETNEFSFLGSEESITEITNESKSGTIEGLTIINQETVDMLKAGDNDDIFIVIDVNIKDSIERYILKVKLSSKDLNNAGDDISNYSIGFVVREIIK